MPAWKKNQFFSNGSAASISMNAEIANFSNNYFNFNFFNSGKTFQALINSKKSFFEQ